jgi:hypothetical protein
VASEERYLIDVRDREAVVTVVGVGAHRLVGGDRADEPPQRITRIPDVTGGRIDRTNDALQVVVLEPMLWPSDSMRNSLPDRSRTYATRCPS